MHVSTDAQGGQNCPITLELELQMVVSYLMEVLDLSTVLKKQCSYK